MSTDDWHLRVRNTDPTTSEAAAASQTEDNIRAVHYAVLDLLDTPMTDEELCDLYASRLSIGDVPPHTDSGVRHRRGELVTRGLIIETEEKRANRSGRMARVWKRAKS